LLIFKQEKLFGRAREENLGSRRIFLTVLAGHQKTLSGPLFAYPWLNPLNGKAGLRNTSNFVQT
jgi:hypothetical protein